MKIWKTLSIVLKNSACHSERIEESAYFFIKIIQILRYAQNDKIVSLTYWKHIKYATILSLFFILPIKTANSDCGIGGRAAINYSIFHVENLNWQSDYAPYLMGYGVIEQYYLMGKTDHAIDDNIGEWRGRFCSFADSNDVFNLIYKTPVEHLAQLRDVTATYQKKEVTYALEDNTFAQVIKGNGCTEVVDYLIFAKECEKYCVKGELWSDKPKDIAQMFFLINRGRQEFKQTDSHFLKLRYAYQMVRLAHYAKDYKAVLDIYDDVIPKISRINSIINYWILAHKAGALKAMGKRAEAAYLFAVVFRYSPSKRRQAFESFDIKTEQEWQQCYNYCRDDRERAALYAVRASYDKAKALDDMAEIYRLDPSNEHLELLLIRETLRLEKILLGNTFRRQRFSNEITNQNKKYAERFKVFIKKVADEKLVQNTPLWRITEGYMTLLCGDVRGAMKMFNQARLITKDEYLLEQIEAFDLAARITGLQGVDEGMNKYIDSIRRTDAYLSDTDFEDMFKEKVAAIYKANGQTGVSYLFDYTFKDLDHNPKLDMINDLITLCRKPEKSQIEKELTTLRGTRTIETLLWDMKGRYHLARFELESANEAFKNVPEPERGKKYTPFADRLNDCITCTSNDTALYDRAGFTQRMLDLEYHIKARMGDIAQSYFLLGLGYYNMTYFGNSSTLADNFRSGTSWNNINKIKNVFPYKDLPLGNYEVTDVSLALDYFEKARQLTTDKEFQAHCAFWCAKCEQNIFFTSKDYKKPKNIRQIPDVSPSYRRYFKLLKESYFDTEFYKQAQTECKYFKFYTNK